MTTSKARFFLIQPGQSMPEDWYHGIIPANMEVGENTVADSSFCFKNYHSILPLGLKLGSYITLWRTSLAVEESGYLEIGDYCYIADASLVCSQRIIIGSHVFIAGGVTIVDSDFHPLEPAARMADTIALSPIGDRTRRPPITPAPVRIGDDVWIGYNVTVLKGVTVGAGATIEPGALVIKDVPPGVTVAGNPAKIVK